MSDKPLIAQLLLCLSASSLVLSQIKEIKRLNTKSSPLARLTQQPNMVHTFAQMPVYQTYPYGFGSHAIQFYGKRMAEDRSTQELLDKWTK